MISEQISPLFENVPFLMTQVPGMVLRRRIHLVEEHGFGRSNRSPPSLTPVLDRLRRMIADRAAFEERTNTPSAEYCAGGFPGVDSRISVDEALESLCVAVERHDHNSVSAAAQFIIDLDARLDAFRRTPFFNVSREIGEDRSATGMMLNLPPTTSRDIRDLHLAVASPNFSVSTKTWLALLVNVGDAVFIDLFAKYGVSRLAPFWVLAYITVQANTLMYPNLIRAITIANDFPRRSVARVAATVADRRDGGHRHAAMKLYDENLVRDAIKADDDELFDELCKGLFGEYAAGDKHHPPHSWAIIKELERRIAELERKLDVQRREAKRSRLTTAEYSSGGFKTAATLLGNAWLAGAVVSAGAKVVRALNGVRRGVKKAVETVNSTTSTMISFFADAKERAAKFLKDGSITWTVLKGVCMLTLFGWLLKNGVGAIDYIAHSLIHVAAGGEAAKVVPNAEHTAAGVTSGGMLAVGGAAMWLMTGGKNVKGFIKEFANWAKTFADIFRSAGPVKEAVDWAANLITRILTWICAKTPFGVPKWLAAFDDNHYAPFRDLNMYSRILSEYRVALTVGESTVTPAFADKVRALIQKIQTTHVKLPKDPRFQKEATLLLREAVAFGQDVGTALVDQAGFAECIGFLLQAEPGTGKSTILKPLAREVYRRVRPETFDDFKGNMGKQYFMRTPGSDYWEGYCGQLFAVLDDFGQTVTVAGQDNDPYSEVIRLINTFQPTLNMANVTLKGKVPFTSEFLLATTNLTEFGAEKNIHDPRALSRRLGNPYRMHVRPEYQTPEGRLDYVKFTRDMGETKKIPDAWTFEEGSWVFQKFNIQFTTPNKSFTFDEIVDKLVSEHQRKHSSFREFQEHLAAVEARLDSRIKEIVAEETGAIVPPEPVASTMAGPSGRSYRTALDDFLDTHSDVDLGVGRRALGCVGDTMYEFLGYDFRPSTERLTRDYPLIVADLNTPTTTTETFRAGMDCYYTLLDPVKRAKYDSWLTRRLFANETVSYKDWIDTQDSWTKRWKKLVASYGNLDPYQIHTVVMSPFVILSIVMAVQLAVKAIIWTLKKLAGMLTGTFGGRKKEKALKKTAKGGSIVAEYAADDEVSDEVVKQFPAYEAVETKVDNNMYYFSLHGSLGPRNLGTITFLEGRIILINRHFVVEAIHGSATSVQLAHVLTGKFTMYSIEDFRKFAASGVEYGGDLLVMKLGPGEQLPRITQHFACLPKNYNTSILNGTVARTFLDLKDQRRYFPSIQSGTVKCVIEYEKGLRDLTNLVSTRFLPKGSCGSHLRISEGPIMGQVLGVYVAHTLGADPRSFAQIVNREELQAFVKTFKSLDSDPAACSPLIAEYASAGFQLPKVEGLSIVGTVKQANPVPMKSKITPSLIHNFKGSSGKKPAPLRRFVRDGEVVDPYQMALTPYAGPARHIDSGELQQAAKEIFDDLKRQNPMPPNRPVWTISQAMEGVDYLDGCDGLNTATSAGYPLSLGTRGKRDFIEEGPKREAFHLEVDERIERAKKGERTLTLYSTFLKSELRSIAKADKGMSRLISGSPLAYTVAFRMYFGSFMDWLFDGRTVTGYTVGINVHGREWDQLAVKNGGLDGATGAGDFTAFDAHQTPGLTNVFLTLANAYYGNDGNALIREVLMQEVFDPTFILGNTVYKWNRGLPSGHPATSYINCTSNLALWYIIWKRVSRGISPLRENLALSTYGDDNLQGKSALANRILPHEVIRQQMASLGFVYTAEDKEMEGLALENRTLKDVSFLKRKFALGVDGGMVAPLELNSILEMVRWVKDPARVEEQTRENVRVALWELAYHTKEVWGEYGVPLLDIYKGELQEVPPALTQREWLALSRARPKDWFATRY